MTKETKHYVVDYGKFCENGDFYVCVYVVTTRTVRGPDEIMHAEGGRGTASVRIEATRYSNVPTGSTRNETHVLAERSFGPGFDWGNKAEAKAIVDAHFEVAREVQHALVHYGPLRALDTLHTVNVAH